MFDFYEVGGKVRDEILGIESKDIDYVVVPDNKNGTIDNIFNTLINYLKDQKFHIFLITPEAFTIRAKFPKNHIHADISADFVLARKELGYIENTRTPIVVPGTLLDDLRRRDFTVNAIAKSMRGDIIDPFNGVNDIEKRLLRTPISGDITFDDDPLRLLRALRFAVTKNFLIDATVSMYMFNFDYEKKFNVVSEERIREELFKCFKHDTLKTLEKLEFFKSMRDYIFTKTNLWLLPTNKK